MENTARFESQIALGLAELRKSRRVTQEELAKILRTKQSVISRIENSVSIPSWKFINKIARALNAEVEITFKPIDSQQTSAHSHSSNGHEYICVNCMYRWESRLGRSVIQCPQCHKRQGVMFSEYLKALQTFQDLKLQVKKSPPFKRPPPLRNISHNTPKMLKLILETAGSTFPSPRLPISLLFRIIEQSRQEQTGQQYCNTLRGSSHAQPHGESREIA
jgi:transcriptional regulator with XRE-family HTH domain